jgi:hypothetical protein
MAEESYVLRLPVFDTALEICGEGHLFAGTDGYLGRKIRAICSFNRTDMDLLLAVAHQVQLQLLNPSVPTNGM